MSAPTMTTSNAAGNLLSSTTIAAGGTNAATNLDVSAAFEAQVQASVTFGTVAATAGVQIDVYRRIGSGPATDTAAMTTLVVAPVASATVRQSLALPTGRYNIKLTNLDATNSVTAVTLTDDVVTGVA